MATTRNGDHRDAESALDASLHRMKFACSDYLDNPNDATDSEVLFASGNHARAFQGARMYKQAGEMRKVHKDFEAANPPKKKRIVASLARTLVR